MSRKPPVRPGITFEVGARLEAQDYLQKWYPSKIEKMDYEEGKMLVHFERWSSRYDEWILWDSSRIRPLERPALRKEGLKEGEEEEIYDFKEGEEVLARWTDCRYYPAKIEAINKEGTYTVQFYDGVIRCLKKMHIKFMPEDAKGQDWIALVKAAAEAAALNKPNNKPRTSVNSSRHKEEKKVHKTPVKKEETPVSKPQDLPPKEEQPTSSRDPEISLEVVPKLSPQHREEELLLKRKMTQTSSFQAKRARLNQITGLLASKAVELDSAEKKPPGPEKATRPEEASSPKPQTQKQADTCHSGKTVTPTQLLPPMSSGKARRKKEKQEPGNNLGSKKSPLSKNDPQLRAANSKIARSPACINQRRPSRRKRTPGEVTSPSFKDGKGLSSIVTKAIVHNAAFVPQEKLEPLDLSCNKEITSPISLNSKIHTDCPAKGKEHLQLLNYSIKAVADGRLASTSSAPEASVLPLCSNFALPNNVKPARTIKKKKPPTVSNIEGKEKPIAVTLQKSPENLLIKTTKRPNEKEKQLEAGILKPEKKVKIEEKISVTSSGVMKPEKKVKIEEKISVTSSGIMKPEKKVKIEEKISVTSSGVMKPEKKVKIEEKISVTSSGVIKPEKKVKIEEKICVTSSGVMKPEKKVKIEEKICVTSSGVMKPEKKVKIEEKISVTSSGKKKEKDKDRKEKKEKEKDPSRSKQKKKKKKKSKPHDYPDFEVSSLDRLERSSSPLTLNNTSTVKNISFQFPRAILSVDLTGENLSDVELLDSSTESLILSGDEYIQEFDSTNFEDSQDEDEAINEIVRCVCQMDEENGFMIQCEECLCWQHSVCMGLLEDSIPEQYVCYVCSDPPGQRWSAKYRYDKDWFQDGQMCGLSFINENYSNRNAKKIVTTHHLLGDVYGVTDILHGLQLKFGILKDKNHPDLRFWTSPIKPRESGQVNHNKRSAVSSSSDRGAGAANHKASDISFDTTEEKYKVTCEHSYQKPQDSDQEGKPSNESRKPDQKVAMLPGGQRPGLRKEASKSLSGERRNNQVIMEEASSERRPGGEQLDSLQRQLNLLSHIENVQNEVTSRMDLIEKEVDVLERWLDFTGDLEPPDPLARRPQLKRRIRQLLTDVGKVQQIAALCTV